ncbi:MAG: extensin family protein [Deltaproteobacteria bacterium]|nr:extensin family protein [Deltaproteobacteria bacterium]
MRRIPRCLLLAAWISACSGDDLPGDPGPPNEGNELPPDGAADEDGAGEFDTGDSDVLVVRDSGLDDVPAMDAGSADAVATDVVTPRDRPVDAAAEAGVPRMDVPRPADTGPPRVDVPRPVDTGPIAVPIPGAVSPGAACHALIQRLGVRFSVAGATRGVVDPVTVTPPIEGVHYRYASWTAAERPMLMDCRLAVALVRMGRELRGRWNIDDVQHLGIYNYRVIAGSTRLSQHAHAMGIDIAGFRSTSRTTYSVLSDFVETSASSCPLRASNAVDRTLKEIACWMYDSRTFNIVLTPNYNVLHRNHYHVDLTAGSHFVGTELPEGVDPPHSPFYDFLIDDD